VTAGRDRDRTLDKTLRHALAGGTDAPASGACLDAETLAAWLDDGLDPEAVARAEAHVSSCVRCQALVGAMVRTAPVVPVGGAARSGFWRWWLAPVAATAAAVTLWMVVPAESPRPVAPEPPAQETAQAPTAGVAEVPPVSEQAETRSAPPASPPVASRPAEQAARQEAVADASASNAKRTRETVSTEGAARSLKSSADVSEQPTALAQSRFIAEVSPVVMSPDPLVRWRIGPSGVVDYTADGGRTWARAATGVTTEIVAGSSPAPEVCWLVGRGGVVLVSHDGRTFARVSVPAEVDLVGVQASDARTAVVTTADGRVFQTADGGLSWRPRE
jgi:hypothetical protein